MEKAVLWICPTETYEVYFGLGDKMQEEVEDTEFLSIDEELDHLGYVKDLDFGDYAAMHLELYCHKDPKKYSKKVDEFPFVICQNFLYRYEVFIFRDLVSVNNFLNYMAPILSIQQSTKVGK